jgi:hypothetical protein
MNENDQHAVARDEPKRKERWHVGKEIPLAVIFGLLMQTGGLVWWMRGLVAADHDHEKRLALLERERETGRLSERVAVIEQAVVDIRRSTERTESLLAEVIKNGRK